MSDEVVGIGETVGKYRVIGKLGEGGMGVVYLAEHVELRKRVALKMLLPEVTVHEQLVARFFNEARAATRIGDPGIVVVEDLGRHPRGAYFVMELLAGESLDTRLEREPQLPPPLVVALAHQLALSLAKAHEASIIHRDLKPANIFLVTDPHMGCGIRVKILDFGIAKLAPEDAGLKTESRAIMGTAAYMSPEQCRSSASVDVRADIYSLGCILYEMSTGRRPFREPTQADLILAQLSKIPPPPRTIDATLPGVLEWIILRCIEKDPRDRFQSMRELYAALDALPRTTRAPIPAAWPEAPAAVAWPASQPAGRTLTRPETLAARSGGGTPASVAPVGPDRGASPTTLGGAAGQSVAPPPPASRRWLLAGGATVVVATATLVGILLTRGGSGSERGAGPPPEQGPAPAAAVQNAAPSDAPTTLTTSTTLPDAGVVAQPAKAPPEETRAPSTSRRSGARKDREEPSKPSSGGVLMDDFK